MALVSVLVGRDIATHQLLGRLLDLLTLGLVFRPDVLITDARVAAGKERKQRADENKYAEASHRTILLQGFVTDRRRGFTTAKAAAAVRAT